MTARHATTDDLRAAVAAALPGVIRSAAMRAALIAAGFKAAE